MVGEEQTIHLHYRRFLDDYDEWDLWLWVVGSTTGEAFGLRPLIHVKTMSPYRDFFGALYELKVGGANPCPSGEDVVLGIQAKWGDWSEKDSPDRELHLGEMLTSGRTDAYLIQGESAIFTSLEDYGRRFVYASIDNQNLENVWLATFEGGDRSKDIFPPTQDQPCFLLDTMTYSTEEIGIAIVVDNQVPDEPEVVWSPSQGNMLKLSCSEDRAQEFYRTEGSTNNLLDAAESKKARTLSILYQRFDDNLSGWSISVWSPNKPLKKLNIKKNVKLADGVLLFELAPSLIPGVSVTGILIRFENSITKESGGQYEWTQDLGHNIFIVNGFDKVMTRTIQKRLVQYTRLDGIPDNSWYLEVCCDGWQSTGSSAQVLNAYPSKGSEGLSFDLSDFWFPPDSTISVRAVKAPPPKLEGDETSTVLYAIADSWRKIAEADFVGELHLLQGSEGFLKEPLSAESLLEQRFVNICYRRLDDDSRGWDLWTWDSDDDFSEPISISPSSKEMSPYAEYKIDRAQYGTGMKILIIGREGGDAWTGKDEPERAWVHDMPGFNFEQQLIMLQGYPRLVSKLEEAVGSITPYVEMDGSIALISDLNPAWFQEKGEELRLSITSRDGRCLNIERIETLSPVSRIIHMDEKEEMCDEDFLVEDYTVQLHNFQDETLMWRRYANWDNYAYFGELGCLYSPEQSVFRCFSPDASLLSVVLYDAPVGQNGSGTDRQAYPMRRIPQGCWKTVVDGDLQGKFYKIMVEGEDKRLFPGLEVIDPYARCTTAHHTQGRGLIHPSCQTEITDRPEFNSSASVIYELHLRDITIDKNSGVKNKGKYLGLTERGTTYRGKTSSGKAEMTVSTALDHILEMGVNTVQIMPIQDFDNDESSEDYRWGYMPVHFNSPDGWYASSTSNFSRVTEFKKLVSSFHDNGIKVILDVVYNHTSEDPNEFNMEARFSFNGLAPRYYYRNCVSHPIAATGHNTCAWNGIDEPHCGTCYSNGSGCGNEFRSDAPMGRKFILDSLRYWAEEYKIDGFRFDLMGLIDQETLTQAAKMLKEIDPGILIYGEPWTGGPSPIIATMKGFQKGRQFGVFNDVLRDALRGGNWGIQEVFLMDGGQLAKVKRGIMGSIDDFALEPSETVNYVECHDNRTLWDQFDYYREQRTDSIVFTDSDLARMSKLAGLVLFTSQGLPFIQAGQEMCRTKGGVENSYESPDSVNMIQWKWKIDRKKCTEYYKGLISLRLAQLHLFAMDSSDLIRKGLIFYEELGLEVPDRCIAFRIVDPEAKLSPDGIPENAGEGRWLAVIVLLNPSPLEQTFALPSYSTSTDSIWIPVVDDLVAGTEPVAAPAVDQVAVRGRSGMVLRLCGPNEHDLLRAYSEEIRFNSISAPFESSFCNAFAS